VGLLLANIGYYDK